MTEPRIIFVGNGAVLIAELVAALRSTADWHDKAGLPPFPIGAIRAAIAKAERQP